MSRSAAEPAELVLEAVDVRYGEPPAEKHVVRGCSLVAERGKLSVIVGPSGCGKSTLVRLIAGYEPPSAGRILQDGVEVRGPSAERLVLFQESSLFPWMTTYENILYGPRAQGRVSKDTLAFAEQLLARVGLLAFRDRYPNQLSGGMQRRAELARALINRPRAMLLDEPFRGLDAMTKELMWQYYAALFDEAGRTDLFVTTDLDEAVFLADRILIVSNIPLRVVAVLEVDVPRPRNLEQFKISARAQALKREALAILYEQALESFGDRTRAAGVLAAHSARPSE